MNPCLELLCQPLPQQQFQVLLTLSPESFASFPHGTCALSDYPPIFSFRWSLPPTLALRSQVVRLLELGPIRPTLPAHGAITLYGAVFQQTLAGGASQALFTKLQFGQPGGCQIRLELLPLHSQLLRES